MLIAGFSPRIAYSDARDKLREKATLQYSAENYIEAKKFLLEIVQEDTSGRFWMDYAMLSDIYLQEGKLDSAKNIISIGKSRSDNAEDPRVRRRNEIVWENIFKQLNHKTDFLIFPKYERLELYANDRIDSLQQAQEMNQKIDELLFASTIDKPVISPGPTVNGMLAKKTAIDSSDTTQQALSLSDNEKITASIYPQLAGGVKALNKYIKDNSLYPDSAASAEIPFGAVVARVKVDTSGIPTDINIIRVKPDSLGFSELAIEVFRNMKYIPAESEGKKISSEFQVPILFRAPEDISKSKEN